MDNDTKLRLRIIRDLSQLGIEEMNKPNKRGDDYFAGLFRAIEHQVSECGDIEMTTQATDAHFLEKHKETCRTIFLKEGYGEDYAEELVEEMTDNQITEMAMNCRGE